MRTKLRVMKIERKDEPVQDEVTLTDSMGTTIKYIISDANDENWYIGKQVFMIYDMGSMTANNWISVDDRLPECGHSVIGWAVRLLEPFMVSCYLDLETEKYNWINQFGYSITISHWQPLPEAPE